MTDTQLKKWLWIMLLATFVSICPLAFYAGMKTTFREPQVYSEAGPSSFLLHYDIYSAMKIKSFDGVPEGTLDLRVHEDEEHSFYSSDGRELDLNVSPELVDNIKPGDTVRVTIELVDPGVK